MKNNMRNETSNPETQHPKFRKAEHLDRAKLAQY
jgi:hypothetical protein